MPRTRPNPDDKVLIEYAAVPNDNKIKGGWVPMVWNNGRQTLDAFRSRGWDKEPVTEQAREFAEVEAMRYSGDWDLTIQERKENPYGSFARGGSPFTAKGRRMEEAVAESGTAEAPPAVVYAAAKRGVPGLVKKDWAREHGYPEPNPGRPRQVLIKRYGRPDQAATATFEADRKWYYEDGSPVAVGGAYVDRILNPHNPLEPSAIEGVAKALWIPAWADYQEEINGESPGPGGDWAEIAPEPPDDVMDSARDYVHKLEKDNNKSLVALLMDAARADGVSGDEFDDEYAEDFGFYITMSGLGHGVSWEDDHEPFPIEIPHVEAYYDGEDLMVSM